MRCVAQYGKYGIQYRPYKANTDHAGVEHVLQEGIYLQFVQGELYENEEREALATFRFRGQFQHEDEATPVDPKYRLSTFDTNAAGLARRVARGDRELADRALDRDPAFMVMGTTPIPKPWPLYDEFDGSGEEVVNALSALGYDLQEALDYERLFGPKRPRGDRGAAGIPRRGDGRGVNRQGIIDVELHPERTEILPDGREMHDCEVTLTEEAHARLRLGYQCGRCFELLASAWPEQCPCCGFPVASVQRELVAQQFAGFVGFPPAGLTSDELARGEAEYLEKVKKARL